MYSILKELNPALGERYHAKRLPLVCPYTPERERSAFFTDSCSASPVFSYTLVEALPMRDSIP